MTAIVCWGFGDLAAIAAIHFSSCRWIEKKALAKGIYRRFYLPPFPSRDGARRDGPPVGRLFPKLLHRAEAELSRQENENSDGPEIVKARELEHLHDLYGHEP
ncbi:hypothetical protein [Rhizobium sp. BK379]|uniref:hypothetical protein n=1 Tax=Rhizobium sp. BK379 TaxID=2587059 RepID=UPI00160C9115|nr:hypothetical protein [Rhizobium sp. BK379]MBB3446790.1 hypothetical protein [Rhizobium sp. BK379]